MIEALLIGLGAALGATAALAGVRALRGRRTDEVAPSERILFPFVGDSLSTAALDATLRLARPEDAVLVAAYLAPVPMGLNLDAPIPQTCNVAFPVIEAIEQRAARAGVPVDSRIGRGRNLRHAMRELMAHERFERIVVPAATDGTSGFSADDVAWLLRNAPGEVLVLRPADEHLLATEPSARALA